MRDPGEEAHQGGSGDHGPAHAFRLQKNGVYFVDLGGHLPELGLHVGDLLLEDDEALGGGRAGRAHLLMALYQRPCSAMMSASALLRASISAAIAEAARSAAMRSWELAASNLALSASIRPLTIGSERKLARP